MPARCWNNFYDNIIRITSNVNGDVELLIDADMVQEVKSMHWTWDRTKQKASCTADGIVMSLQRFLYMKFYPGMNYGNIRMLNGPQDFRRQSMHATPSKCFAVRQSL
jgi:hypothetical protein